MMKNTAIDYYRKRSREKTQDESLMAFVAAPEGGPLDEIIRDEEAQKLYHALDALNDRDRELVERRYFMGQKPAQISEDMSLPVREVENRLYRIKATLRKQMR